MQEYTTESLQNDADQAKRMAARYIDLNKLQKHLYFRAALVRHVKSIINFDELPAEQRAEIVAQFTQDYKQAIEQSMSETMGKTDRKLIEHWLRELVKAMGSYKGKHKTFAAYKAYERKKWAHLNSYVFFSAKLRGLPKHLLKYA